MMKRTLTKLTLTLAALSTLTLTACEDFLDVNDNPNKAVAVPADLRLPAALVSTVNEETVALNQLGALWGGYWGTTNEGANLFTKEKAYSLVAITDGRDGIPFWENGYTTLLTYQLLRQEAEGTNSPNYAGIAKIMQGWHFLRLVDLYNNIPFDDALQGTVRLTPRYEDGQQVYGKAVDLITEGMQDIKNAPQTAPRPGPDDVVFQGNMTRWLKLANTVKLRALLRQSQAGTGAYVQAELAKIQAEGSGFLNAGESANVQPGYLVTAGKQNPFWEAYYRTAAGIVTANFTDLRPTEFILSEYQRLNDPRLARLYARTSAGQYRGVVFGAPATSGTTFNRANTSTFLGPRENNNLAGGLFKSAQQPSVLLSSMESLFLQAEAAERGWLATATARSLYEAAIRESFLYLEVPAAAAAVATYLAQPTVRYDQAPNKLERLITQKWLALNSISSIEAWNDYRRLGFPAALPNSPQAPSPTARPLRLLYPETERTTNGPEVGKQGSLDGLTDKVWWDQ
ncbi:hypothetical protein GCM10011375_40210 [Hymenobacter qilianensis]|uniref:Uncharacterized protein n=2 Tax=Hymenobacter qilianensis TaxID=1385715 RepID=A0ACB5PX88_9BACT|nr:SusD/RagB family nutrient-binding outer membrane lipoprotein [Hymenobacter qilianensis]GGF81202.1 hypothetical protein GCM10011375_40210 [Hymenobacter qilianensis]